MEILKNAYQNFQETLEKLDPELLLQFNTPASPEEISSFEQKNDIKLPPAVHFLYSQANGIDNRHNIIGGWEWCSLEIIQTLTAEVREMMTSSPELEEIDTELYLPLFIYNGEDVLCVRLDEKNGKLYYIPYDFSVIKTMSESLYDFLNTFVQKIDNNEMALTKYDSPYGQSYIIAPHNRAIWMPDSYLNSLN